ncbi:hypothetical protein BKA61DRAFT_612750 [Leptodontidium sp. MPI-SDFR-AT-0119]|nr:hypothetical protein BKA61DRAFT_612750 [Leptodontidium sp. MPI-SDFR-AT-0119]
MSHNQIVIYKYGCQAQPSYSQVAVAQSVNPTSSTAQYYSRSASGPSRMSGQSPSHDVEREKLWEQDRLDRELMKKFGSVFGVYRDPEHKRWEEEQDRLHSSGGQSSSAPESSYQNSSNSGDLQYKLARILDPTRGETEEVTVLEDSCCQVNFVHPRVAKACNLNLYPAPPIKHAMMKGTFESNRGTEIRWIGQDGRNGSAWFYLAPEDAPRQLELLVGTHFMSKNPDAFGLEALPGPTLLNVQTPMNASGRIIRASEAHHLNKTDLQSKQKNEPSQIQIDEANADAKAAELAEKKRQAKHRKATAGHQKQTQNGSSSRNSGSKRK